MPDAAVILQRQRRDERLARYAALQGRFHQLAPANDPSIGAIALVGEPDEELSTRAVTLTRAALNVEEGSGDILFPNAVLCTDIPCPRIGFNRYGEIVEFLEILDPFTLDTARGLIALPMLLDHNMWDFEAVVGEWTNLRAERGADGISRLIGDGRVFNLPDLAAITGRISRQSTTFFSVGYTPDMYIEVTTDDDEMPVLQTERSTLYEGSVVGVPADADSHRRLRALDAIKGGR